MNKWFPKIFLITLLVLCISGWVATIYYFLHQDLTSRESILLSLLQTIFSFFASWALTHFYGDYQHKDVIESIKKDYESNLRVYANKAAEKVDNLSNELLKLAYYLQQEVDSENEDVQNDLLIKEEKIRSAIHIINTLKSVNDKSLSDWKGVVSEEELEEIDEKREALEASQENLVEAISKFNDIRHSNVYSIYSDDNRNLKGDIEILDQKLNTIARQLSTSLGFVPAKLSRRTEKKIEVIQKCPDCNLAIIYRQRPKNTSSKKVKCNSCGKVLLARWNEDVGFYLESDREVAEVLNCICGSSINVILSIFPDSKKEVNCSDCQRAFMVIRKLDKIQLKEIAQEVLPYDGVIPEDLIAEVRSKIPPQPWSKGMNSVLAEQTGLSHSVIRKITNILIQRGVYKVQVDGKLYIEDNLSVKKDSPSEGALLS